MKTSYWLNSVQCMELFVKIVHGPFSNIFFLIIDGNNCDIKHLGRAYMCLGRKKRYYLFCLILNV